MASTISTSQSIPWLPSSAEWIVDRSYVEASVVRSLDSTEERSKVLPRPLVSLVVDYLRNGRVCGEEVWRICGRVASAPALPSNIEQILRSPCPIFPEKETWENHMLVYIPTAVDDKPLTLKTLRDLVKRFFRKTVNGYRNIYDAFSLKEVSEKSIEKSYWALMTTDVLPESRYKTYRVQQKMVADIAARSLVAYKVPRALEVAVCIFMEYFRSQTCLFGNDPLTYTRCEETLQCDQVIVGDFTPDGLRVRDDDRYNGNMLGIAAVLREVFGIRDLAFPSSSI